MRSLFIYLILFSLLTLSYTKGMAQCEDITATVSNVNNANCFGAGSGSATVTGLNGAAPYTYTLILNANIQTGPSANNVFNGLVSGNYNFIVEDDIGCIYEGSFQILQPDDPQVFISGIAASFCEDGDAVFMFGSPVGGTFSGPGVSGNNFDPSIAGQGFHTITYTYVAADGCTYFAYHLVEVGLPTEFTFNIPEFFCQTDTNGFYINVSPAGGTLLGPGIADDGLFYPTVAGAGTHTLNYYYFDGTCFNIIETQVTVDYPLPIFSYSVSNMTTVSFTGPPGMDSYSWSLGDGTVSSQPNPNYSYDSTGSYSVCLTVELESCTGIYCEQVNLTTSTLIPEFTYTIFTTTLVFDDNSLGATSWFWDFGNGFTSTQENPIHNFILEGSYEVCLTVSNGTDTLTTCQYIYIVCPIPQADYFYATNGLTLSTSNISVNGTEFLWDFGDGTSSFFFDPIHTYAYEGTYDVCLTAANNCGANQLCKEVVIVCPAPEVSISVDPDNYTIDFDATVLNANVYTWDFGDGITSNDINPVHTYSDLGTYIVCLEAVNDCGTTLECFELDVECLLPDASFTYEGDLLTVSFSSNDPNADSYLWNFGNMNTSTDANPSFTFDASGSYTVCLETMNECGTDNHCEVFDLSCLPTVDFLFASADLNLFITSNTSQNATDFLWDYGDGNTSTDFTPFYTYEVEGEYTLCLTSSNSCGSVTLCDTVSIVCPLPEVDFVYSINDLVVSFTAINPQGLITYDFGDGVTSNIPEIEYIYQQQGTFNVCLFYETDCGIDSLCQEVIINCPPPSALFSAAITGPYVSLESLDGPFQNYMWTLNGDSASVDEEPTLLISEEGDVDICLIIDNACGQSTECMTVYIEPCSAIEITELIIEQNPCTNEAAGMIDVIVSGGINPLLYSLTGTVDINAQSSNQFIELPEGMYTLTVSDSIGCDIVIDSILISSPDEMLASYIVTSPDCTYGTLGSIDINVQGGTMPYSFSIDSGLTSTTQNSFNELEVGLYEILITDGLGCAISESYLLEGTGDIQIIIDDVVESSASESNGMIDISILGGNGPYTYEWSNGDSTEDISGISAGEYTVIVSDNSGCQNILSITLPASVNVEDISLSIQIYPSPVFENMHISSDVYITYQLYSETGKILSETLNSSPNHNLDMTDYPSGIYILKIMSSDQDSVLRKIIKI